ncbi:MAG: MCE family protein [Mycobacteriales bacterium]
MTPPLRHGTSLLRQRVLGLAFLAVLGALVAGAVGLYQKAFTPVVHVTLEADRAGNQLSKGADVKLRGVLVGEVRAVHSVGDGARLDLALDPAQARRLPRDLTAQLLPTTLFGEKYVALQTRDGSAGEGLRDGAVIPQDRSSTALETEQAVDDLLPVLQALKPQDLSTALNALSGALRGRGDRAGAELARSAAYLRRLDPQLPTLQQDLAGLADVASSTADATPALLQVLDNLAFSSRSLTAQRAQLDTFLTATNGFAASAHAVVQKEAQALVRLASASVPVLATYADEAPGYPCLLKALTAQEPVIEKSFGGLQPGLHLTLEAVQDNGGYTAGQEPRYGDTGGTFCYSLDPAHPVRPALLYYNPVDGYDDGQEVDPYTGKPPCTHKPCAQPPTRAGASATRLVVAPLLGVPVDRVPDVATVLLQPLAQGSAVGLSG